MKAKTFPKETGSIVAHLREMFRRVGRGSMIQATRALGLRRTYYSEKRHRRRFDAGVLVATLRKLDISPAAFFAELEGGADPCLWGPAAERSTPETRRAVRGAYRRMRAELAGVDLVAELEDVADVDDEIPAAAGGAVRGAAWLEDLDGRRLDEPEAVAAEIAASLDQVDAALLPAVLGAWSSALRLVLELETAAYLNRWALRLAQAAGDSSTVADLYIRRSYIVADAGDHGRALTLAELAAGIFARLGDQADEGRALVDCGRWLHYLSRNRESVAALERAVSLIPESLPRSRFGTLQALGIVALDLGDAAGAERYAKLAEPLAANLDDYARAKVLLLKARIARKLGRLVESEGNLRRSLDIFRGVHLGEAALAAVELVQVSLEQGKPGEARQVCESIHSLLEPLERNPIIAAAIGELLTASFSGSLALNLVKRIKTRIKDAAEDATARRQWRALAMA